MTLETLLVLAAVGIALWALAKSHKTAKQVGRTFPDREPEPTDDFDHDVPNDRED